MRKGFTRKFLKILIVLLILVIIVFSAGTYFLIKNQDGITNMVVKQLNEHLVTPIHHEKINLSLFKKIPYISVEFKNVWAETPAFDNRNDTLFSVQSAYVLLNIFEAIRGNYSISKLQLNNGSLNLYINAEGKANYYIWEKSSKKSNRNYQVNLQDIIFQNIKLTYYNQPNNFGMASTIHNLKLNGEFNKRDALLNLKSNLYINYIYRGDIKYMRNGNAGLNVSISKNADILRYKEGQLRVNKQRVETQGYFNMKSGDIDISLSGKGIRFDSDQNIFNLDKSLTSFSRVTGVVYTIARVSGNTKTKNELNIVCNFNLNNGVLSFKNQKLRYNIHYLKGRFKSFQKNRYDIFEIDSLYLTGNGDTLNGFFNISNFSYPKLMIRARASLNAGNINAFITDKEEITFGRGRLHVTWFTQPVFIRREDLWKHFIQQSRQTYVHITETDISFPRLEKGIKGVNGDFYLNNSLNIRNFSFTSPDMDAEIEGDVSSLYNLVSRQNTWINLKGHSEKADILKLIAFPKSTESDGKNMYPQHLYLNYESLVKKLVIDGNTYENARSDLYYKPGLATLKVYTSGFFGGNLKGNCALALPAGEEMEFAVIAEAKDVDITSLFVAYKEFGQDFITSKNLKGKLNVNLNFKSKLTSDFVIDTKTIVANAGVQIKNGELLEHEPMYSLSKYVKLEELKHIYFADLSNEVFIKDACVTIPNMQIISTALDIEMSGRHYFDNRYEYQLTLYISDLLAKKVKKTRGNDDAFTFTQRNNAKHFKIPLTMRGDDVNFEVEINKKQAREIFSESVKKEGEEIKNVLRREFKIFSKDTVQIQKTGQHTEFKLQFEENEQKNLKDPVFHENKDKKNNSELKFEFGD